jgi:4-amino-4-deoxy-L-arabinose transferase-like glycosyltransferase
MIFFDKPENPKSGYYLIALLILALVPRIGCALLRPPTVESVLTRLNDSTDYDHLAQKILEGEFTSPSGAPTAFRAPAYPAFLALIYLIFGKQNLIAVAVIQAILGALNCLLIMKLSERITGSKPASWIAALIAAFYPAFILQVSQILTEVLGRFLWLLAMTILIESSYSHKKKGFILGGIIFGLAVLNKSVLLITLPVLIIWLGLKINAPLPDRIKTVFIYFLLPVSIMVGTWTMRNFQISGKRVPVSTNFPVTFAHGFTPYCYYAKKWYGSERLMAVPENFPELTQMRFYKDAGEEIEIGEYYSQKARDFIRENPGFFLRLSVRKFSHFWSPFISNAPLQRLIALLSMAPVLFLGWAGIVLSLREKGDMRDYAIFILATSLLICVPYILSQPDVRYRVGLIEPFWIIYSGLALVFPFRKVRIPLPGGASDRAPGGVHDG